jgi:hypothetical protein
MTGAGSLENCRMEGHAAAAFACGTIPEFIPEFVSVYNMSV